MGSLLISTLLIIGMGSSASATTLYDEAVDGDAGDGPNSPAVVFGILDPGVYQVFGAYDAGSFSGPGATDEFDAYNFGAATPVRIDFTSSGDGRLALFRFDEDLSFALEFLGPTVTSGGVKTVGAGFYGFNITSSGGAGTGEYTATITIEAAVIPLPASAYLLVGALGAAGLLARRGR